MNKLIILAVLLAVASCAIKKQTTHYVDTKTVLAEMDKDRFGNTFISAIALNIAAKTPQDDLVVYLEQIVAHLDSTQAKADEKNRTDQAICDEQLGNFREQISDQQKTVESLGNAIRENQGILDQAKTDLEQANKDYDETIDQIEKGTAQREQEHGVWTETDYQMSIQIATLEEGVKLIQHMIHGVAFAQIKVRYDKVLDKLKSTEGKRATLFKPLIASLATLATKLNYENVMKILDLLNNIRAAILEEQTANRIQEEKAQADWDVLLSHLENQKKALADKKERLANLIESTIKLLAQLNTSLENHKTELENLQNSFTAQTNWCDKNSEVYETESTERARQIDTLVKLVNHLVEKFGAVSDYVASRAGAEF